MEKSETNNKLIITELQFKEIFKLASDCKVSENNIIKYQNFIIGAYLLYNEIMYINQKKFSIVFNNEKIKLQACYGPYSGMGFQDFVHTNGSKSKIEVSYFDDTRKEMMPFWTYTKFKNPAEVQYLAYQQLIEVIKNIVVKYYNQYGIEFKFIDYSRNTSGAHPNNKIYIDGIEFSSKLDYINSKGNSEFIPIYSIVDSITNRSSIWTGKILEPIQKIINTLKIKED